MRTPLDIAKGTLRRRALAPLTLALALGAGARILPACSLGNVAHDDCTSSAECAAAFGLGSACAAGYCTKPPPCATGHDCRAAYGGGACVNGACLTTIPSDPACPIVEPEDLFSKSIVGDEAPILIGSIFSLGADFDVAQTKAVRLAVREVNRSGGMVNGRPLAAIFCDNGGPMNAAAGDARKALNEHAMDYLAGTLGAPVVVGPLRSSDSFDLLNRALSKKYPTVIISPSATSPSLTKQPDKLDPGDVAGLFWRTCPSDELQGRVLATSVVPPGIKVAVIYLQDAYGEGLSTVFQETYKTTMGPMMEPSTTAAFPFDSKTDLKGLAASVAAEAPGALLIISVQAVDAIAIMKELALTAIAQTKPLFFFTDGSKDNSKLLDPTLPGAVIEMIQGAKGTAPARPSGPNYDLFKINLASDFMLSADDYAFLAQSYDAGYVGAYGVVYASRADAPYDGRQVAEGMTHLSQGTLVDISPTKWSTGKAELSTGALNINLVGTSGDLDFDAATGEAPGPIEIWKVSPNLAGFETDSVVKPGGN